MRRFTDLQELDSTKITELLASARDLQRDPIRDALRGRVLGLIFLNPSLRTLASCQAGMAQLGGSSFVIQPGQGTWDLETQPNVVMDGTRAEHIDEAIPVLEEYCDAIGLRCFAKGDSWQEDHGEPILSAVDAIASKPWINLESAVDHPCQALADWKTLDDHEVPAAGGKFVLSWAWHPKPLPLAVPAATLAMAARRGMDVTVLRPDGFELPREVMMRASEAAKLGGGTVQETDDPAAATEGAHVIYAKSWTASRHYGEPEAERVFRDQYRNWCVDESWFSTARAEAIFMHCLPVRRNVVVADEVLDGPRSRVIPQAGNRLHTVKAVLLDLISNAVTSSAVTSEAASSQAVRKKTTTDSKTEGHGS